MAWTFTISYSQGAIKEAQRQLVEDDTNNRSPKANIYEWPEPCCQLDEWHDNVGGPGGDTLIGYTCAKQSTCQGNYKACHLSNETEVVRREG